MKQLAYNKEAESALLGALIVEPSEIFSLDLDPSDFYDSRNRQLYETILRVFSDGKQPDLVSIVFEYDRRYNPPESIAGYASSLTDDLYPIDFNQTAKLVKESARQRKLQIFLQKTLDTKWDSAESVLESLQAGLLKHQVSEKKPSNIKDVAFRIHDQININKKRGAIGERTGFRFLRVIEGFIKTHFWTIGAYTSVGKTAFMVQLIVNGLKENNMLKIAVFSTEMSDEGLLLRLMANRTGIPSMAILKGDSIPKVQERIDEAFEYFHTKDVWIHDDLYTFEKIFLRCKQLKMTKGLDIVFVDFLQNMQGEGSIYERMSVIPVQLQKMAKDLDICVVGMSQISNEAAHGDSKLIGYKGAGEIAAACDLGLWLERDKDDNAKLICSIRKNRHGMIGKKSLVFVDNFTRIIEME